MHCFDLMWTAKDSSYQLYRETHSQGMELSTSHALRKSGAFRSRKCVICIAVYHNKKRAHNFIGVRKKSERSHEGQLLLSIRQHKRLYLSPQSQNPSSVGSLCGSIVHFPRMVTMVWSLRLLSISFSSHSLRRVHLSACKNILSSLILDLKHLESISVFTKAVKPGQRIASSNLKVVE